MAQKLQRPIWFFKNKNVYLQQRKQQNENDYGKEHCKNLLNLWKTLYGLW